MDATVRIGDRTGEDSEWVMRSREAKRALEQSLVDEKLALSKLPYTEEELRKGLESLKARATDEKKAVKPADVKPADVKPVAPTEDGKPLKL